MRVNEAREATPGAGHDPEKHQQILAGAREVFLERGFDAASMGDIARVAGVSKGTLYVYFEDKADLFASLVICECGETAERMFELDAGEPDIEAALVKLGVSFVEAMVRPGHMATLRMVIAVSGKFPSIGRRFLDAGPVAGTRRLADFLQAKVEQGVLDIDDVESAASQLLMLCKDEIMMPILLAAEDPPDAAHIERVVRRAVAFFLRGYGRPEACSAQWAPALAEDASAQGPKR